MTTESGDSLDLLETPIMNWANPARNNELGRKVDELTALLFGRNAVRTLQRQVTLVRGGLNLCHFRDTEQS